MIRTRCFFLFLLLCLISIASADWEITSVKYVVGVTPVIAFVSPTPQNGNTTNNTWLYLNVTCDVGCENVSATTKDINNTKTTYYLINDTPNNWHLNITGLTYGQIISFNATGNTTLGAKGYSDNRAITFYICGSLPSSLTLLYDVVANQTCFTLGASSIILDCNGHTIHYSTVSGASGYGVLGNSLGSSSIIKNCIFIRGASVWQSSAIRAYAINSININNVTASVNQGTDYAIGLIGVSTANITNSNISCSGTPCQALLLSPTGSSTTNIEVWNSTLSAVGGNAISAQTSNAILVADSNLTSTTTVLNFLGNVFNTLFRNSYINGTTFLQTGLSNNYDNYFLNTTIPTLTYSLTSTSNFTRQWYARINVTNARGSPVTSTIIVTDNQSQQVYNKTYSLTPYFVVNETTYRSTTNIQYNNQTITVNSSDYDNFQMSFNFSSPDTTVNITLRLTPIPEQPIGGYPIYPKCQDGTQVGACSVNNPTYLCSNERTLQPSYECMQATPEEKPLLPSWWQWSKFWVAICALVGMFYLWDEKDTLFQIVPELPEEEMGEGEG